MIRTIDAADVHRITSGQVIVDMSSIVKELVENSIDAHATVIEVQLKNYGLETIEVADNGDGIASNDFKSIALKHYTSKLSSFSELEEVDTMGFRGEALSSLCSIGTVSIVTTQSPPMAHSLTFHESGELNEDAFCKRSKGTTVTITNLFHDLPVRLKDLNKNYKREFNKCIGLLQSYALIHTDVKFSVQNVNKQGKKTSIIQSQGQNSLKSNIISIFGSTGFQGLAPLDFKLDLNKMKPKLKLSNIGHDYTIHLNGFISKIGFGRPANDRQYFYINKRPVFLKQWSKVINEVYKTFSNVRSPVVILDLKIDPHFIDLNVTPDKRMVLIHNESRILDELRTHLIEFYDIQDLSIPRNSSHKLVINDDASDEILSDIKGQFPFSSEDHAPVELQERRKSKELDISVKRAKVNSEQGEVIDDQRDTESTEVSDDEYPSDLEDVSEDNQATYEREIHTIEPSSIPTKRKKQPTLAPRNKLTLLSCLSAFRNGSQEKPVIKTRLNQSTVETIIKKREYCDCQNDTYRHDSDMELESIEEKHEDGHDEGHIRVNENGHNDESKSEEVDNGELEMDSLNNDIGEVELLKYTEIGTAKLFETIATIPEHFVRILDNSSKPTNGISIDDIDNQEESEKYLTLTVSKKDFRDMKIIGQFNLGFILVIRTKDNKRDMFIIDQHASDEKYNFEELQRDTVMENQRLVIPQSLELNVIDELIVTDHQDIFSKNGFQIKINMDAIPGERVQLISLPISKRITFDTADFYELIHLIKEQQTNLGSIRCSKVRSMLAMRACRKSIMIGKHLSHRQMSQVVSHLGGLDKPWNCPHGRPTMRHLMELEWEPFNEDYTV
jgi:DNA mismatch repair protein PMS2